MSPFVRFSEFTGRVSGDRSGSAMHRPSSVPFVSDNQKENGDGGARSVSSNERASSASDVVPGTGLGCTHLWLQSRVPLGYASLPFSSSSSSSRKGKVLMIIILLTSDVFLLNLWLPSSLSYFH